MKVLLINPPYATLKEIFEKNTHLALPYLAAVLDQNDIDFKYLDLEKFKLDKYYSDRSHDINDETVEKNYWKNLFDDNNPIWQFLKKETINYKPDIIAISSTTPAYYSAVRVVEIIKIILPNTKFIIGGPHATVEYEDILKENLFDFVVRGEGEQTFLELVKAIDSGIKDYSNILGISYRINENFLNNPNREIILNLDTIPSPQKHYKLDGSNELIICIAASRGCNNKCNYCSTPFLWPGLRTRSPQNIVAEIKEALRIHGNRIIAFHDPNFNFNKKRIVDLCREIIKNNLNITAMFLGNLNIIDDELCKIMKRAGFVSVYAGVETGDQDMMGKLNKNLTIEEIEKSVKILHKNGIACNAFTMYGLPDQSIESMRKTNKLLREVDFWDVWYSMFFPIPGSEFYFRLKRDNYKFNFKNLTFTRSKSFFDYHNLNPEFESVIREAHEIVRNKRSFFKKILWALEYVFSDHNYISVPKNKLERIKNKLINLINSNSKYETNLS